MFALIIAVFIGTSSFTTTLNISFETLDLCEEAAKMHKTDVRRAVNHGETIVTSCVQSSKK